jgi:hypothetical protein
MKHIATVTEHQGECDCITCYLNDIRCHTCGSQRFEAGSTQTPLAEKQHHHIPMCMFMYVGAYQCRKYLDNVCFGLSTMEICASSSSPSSLIWKRGSLTGDDVWVKLDGIEDTPTWWDDSVDVDDGANVWPFKLTFDVAPAIIEDNDNDNNDDDCNDGRERRGRGDSGTGAVDNDEKAAKAEFEGIIRMLLDDNKGEYIENHIPLLLLWPWAFDDGNDGDIAISEDNGGENDDDFDEALVAVTIGMGMGRRIVVPAMLLTLVLILQLLLVLLLAVISLCEWRDGTCEVKVEGGIVIPFHDGCVVVPLSSLVVACTCSWLPSRDAHVYCSAGILWDGWHDGVGVGVDVNVGSFSRRPLSIAKNKGCEWCHAKQNNMPQHFAIRKTEE